MGYKNKSFRVDLSELADGCFVEIKNPLLMPVDRDLRSAKLDADGNPEPGEAVEITKQLLSKLIIAWKMWDVETDAELPLPSEDPTALERCPQAVWVHVGQEVQRRTNPQLSKTP